ncbi:hypothetical protein KFE25_011327 [Diacronema lutheri]|uniref:cGMP-dependent protein kinase n=1 Tax=Diacronema lutheri TaxID=2081491 RepID=A0A8J5X3G7_DIALT|nr:hypothetical protein KFE25_011327 [Diacronema lutheri]
MGCGSSSDGRRLEPNHPPEPTPAPSALPPPQPKPAAPVPATQPPASAPPHVSNAAGAPTPLEVKQPALAVASALAPAVEPPAAAEPLVKIGSIQSINESVRMTGERHPSEAKQRREAVSDERDESDPSFTPPVYPKSDGVRAQILESIRRNPLFLSLSPAQLSTVVDAMAEEQCELHSEVIKEGDEYGDRCYVVGSGSYCAYKGKKLLVSYSAGDLFGELAVMYGCRRAATVVCEKPGQLWAIDRRTFKAILKGAYASTAESAGEYLKTVPILSGLSDEQRQRVTGALTAESYDDGALVLKYGEVGEKLFIVKSGELSASRDDGVELTRMRQGEFFGESALEGSREPRKANVVAKGPVEVLSISAADFETIIGSLTDVLQNNLNQRIIDSIELLSYLTRSQRKELVENLRTHRVPAGTKLLEQGTAGSSFYIIQSGECTVMQTVDGGASPVVIATLEMSGYFGERSLLKDEPCNATVVAKTDCVLMRLGMADFRAILGKNLQDIIDEEIRQREDLARQAVVGATGLAFHDLELLSVLGEGSFGRVKLVRHRPTNRALALKCLRKGQLIKYKQVEHVLGEKAVMLACKHPFVVRLEAVFHSTDQVYMALELLLGGELFSLLRIAGRLEEQHARFYSAIVVSAFSYLHERYVCHRDLKPENLLFDKDGYLKLVDMGFAKVVRDRTWTLCGTPEYLAPEIIGNKGHNQAVDWWTLGVLLFEMAAGYPPFAGSDQMDTYQRVMRGKVKFPPGMSASCKDLISKLLTHNPAQRIGSLKGGSKDVRNHPFYMTIDWRALEARQLAPPFVPKLRDNFDTSNYDKYPDDAEDAAHWRRFLDTRYDPIWDQNFGRQVDARH